MSVSIAIGDVGHGNCALLREGDYSALIDAAPGGVPENMLRDAGLSRVDDLVISHADDDHLGGLTNLLRQFQIGRVWINGDPIRAGRTWDAARAALSDAERHGRTVVRAGVGAGTEIASPGGRLLIKVVAPAGWNLLWGTGAAPAGRAANTANGLSAIVAVLVDGVTEALLPGDADARAFADLNNAGADLRARLLVFPHHGGRPGRADPARFAASVCAAVEPRVVVFSVGRGRRGFPRPEVVEAVRSALPDAHVACTQLAVQCAAELPPGDPTHLHPMPAGGKSTRSCCSGALEVQYPPGCATFLPLLDEHRRFVQTSAPTRMCL